MKKGTWKPYVLAIVLTEAIGALAGFLTRDGVELYQATAVKPALTPPPVVFPIVWSILYVLMGIGAARIWLAPPSEDRSRSLTLYVVQLAFNFLWSILFFGLHRYGLALIWLAVLWLLILFMILSFRKVDPAAAWLQVPYLLWVTFAAYLNFGVWRLN